MSAPYIGEIRIFAGNFPPSGWLFCEGQLLAISENDALFTLIGTTYGGNGESTFALPDLRSRVPVHQGNGTSLAQTGGVEMVTLTVNQIPAHSHPTLVTSAPGTANRPTGLSLAASPTVDLYETGSDGWLAPTAVSATGGSQPHENVQPYLALNHIISLYGVFPNQS